MGRGLLVLPVLGLVVVGAMSSRSSSPSSLRGDYLFKQARFYRPGRAMGEPIWIVLHTAEDHELPGEARGLMTYAANPSDNREVSWHYAVDDREITQSVLEADTAFAAGPGNAQGIHIEMVGSALQGAGGWGDAYSRAVIENAAELVREIQSRHPQIPLRRLSDASDLIAGKSGITDHATITRAAAMAMSKNLRVPPWFDAAAGRWRVTTHGDVGPTFPWDDFMALVGGSASSEPPAVS